ncbi:cytochrome P450 [Streptomyces sp. NBC_01136]|uniref:cytochrome P450 n=1 Tax=unclassified Streptomyces TaxID=2593676 RepID=UPI003249EB75|nr:cytochrome P450 [Streptomyces sp. NBC_01136]
MGVSYQRQLECDPFEYIKELRHRSSSGVFRLPWGGWCVSDADLARVLLRDPEFNAGMSGFFGDLLPTRSAQVDVGHAVRDLLRAHVSEYRGALVTEVARLPKASPWPTTATDLVYRGLAELLLTPDTPSQVRRLMDKAVHGGVVFRAPHAWQRARAEVLRAKLIATITEQVGYRRGNRSGDSRDVLDAVLGACPNELTDRKVAEVFLVMYRSIVAPVSASLAWSVLLANSHHESDSPPPWPADWIVRESLRHCPMVWMVGRRVHHPTEFGGIRFQTGDILSVSPYLLHHGQQGWPDHDVFRPERWAEPGQRGPYIPFGAGPFTCAGAAVAHLLMTEALTALTSDTRLTIVGGDLRPVMVEGAVPRPFTVHRIARQVNDTEGR